MIYDSMNRYVSVFLLLLSKDEILFFTSQIQRIYDRSHVCITKVYKIKGRIRNVISGTYYTDKLKTKDHKKIWDALEEYNLTGDARLEFLRPAPENA